MALAYLGRPLTYTDAVGLWLNLPRVMLRDGLAVAHGTGIAFRRGPLERAYFDALALVEEEAEELMFRTNVERARQSLYARHGVNPNG